MSDFFFSYNDESDIKLQIFVLKSWTCYRQVQVKCTINVFSSKKLPLNQYTVYTWAQYFIHLLGCRKLILSQQLFISTGLLKNSRYNIMPLKKNIIFTLMNQESGLCNVHVHSTHIGEILKCTPETMNCRFQQYIENTWRKMAIIRSLLPLGYHHVRLSQAQVNIFTLTILKNNVILGWVLRRFEGDWVNAHPSFSSQISVLNPYRFSSLNKGPKPIFDNFQMRVHGGLDRHGTPDHHHSHTLQSGVHWSWTGNFCGGPVEFDSDGPVINSYILIWIQILMFCDWMSIKSTGGPSDFKSYQSPGQV